MKLKNNNTVFVDGMYSDITIINLFISLSKIISPENESLCVNSLSSPRVKEKAINKIKFLRYKPYFFGFFMSIKYLMLFLKSVFLGPTAFKKIFFINGVNCFGDFIDTLHIKHGLKLSELSKVKLLVYYFYELSFFLYFKKYFKKNHHNISNMILGDTAYRYGYFAKFSMIYNIPLLCNIDLNALIFNYYSNGYSKDSIPRKIENQDIAYVMKNFDINTLDEYFIKRFNGQIKQHDVLKAFSSKSDNLQLSELNSLKESKNSDNIIVTLFAHVFTDAPHNIPGLLFEDFYDWFLYSVKSLLKNKNVILLIKEHPSASLYKNEKGLVADILKNNFNKDQIYLFNDINSDVLIDNSDFIVTASGTVIYEALYKEKSVVIASEKTFNDENLLYDFDNKNNYLTFLENLNVKDILNLGNEINIKYISYIHFVLLNNRSYLSNFPVNPYVRGEKFKTISFEEIYTYMKNDSKFKKSFDYFIKSEHEIYKPNFYEL